MAVWLVAALFVALATSCSTVKDADDQVVLGLKILRFYRDGVHMDATDHSYSWSTAEAEATTDNYRGKIVYLAFVESDEIAKLKPNDTLKCRISRRILEEHLEAIKDPTKTRFQLNRPDFTLLEINGVAVPQ